MVVEIVVVTPRVDHAVTTAGDAADVGTKHLAPLDQKLRQADAVVVAGVLHVVVGIDGKAHAPVGLGIHADVVNLGRHGVVDILPQELQGVKHVPRAGVVNLKMEMRAEAVAGIAAEGNELTLRHRAIGRSQAHVGLVRLVGVLPLLQQPFQSRREALEVAIDAGIAFGMRDIDSIAEAGLAHGEAADIAVADGHDGLALDTLRTEIQSAVEVVGAGFAKIARQ